MKRRPRWGRILAVGLIAGAAILTSGYLLNGDVESKAPEYVNYTVRPGDTLWTIADKHIDSSKDIRYTIYTIKEDNHLQANEHLQVGQQLKIRK